MKNKKILGIIVICLVVSGFSFWGGMEYASSKNSSNQLSRQGNFSQNGFGQNGGTRTGQGMRNSVGGGLVAGEILSKDDKSLTIKLNNGGSKIVLISPSTKVEKTVDGTTADATVGKQVTIIGTANSDGSVSATSVQLRPILENNLLKTN